MNFNKEFMNAKLVQRYKRFIVDAMLDTDEIVSAFCSDENVFPNLYEKNASLWVSRIHDKKRHLKYEVEAVNKGDGWVVVNQQYFFNLFEEAFTQKLMSDFVGYHKIRRLTLEDKLPHVDFELSNDTEKCFISLRPIYNKQDGKAVFPSKVNFLDMEMFEEMKKIRSKNVRTVVLLLVPRMDCLETVFSWTIDPVSAAKIYDEAKNGLEFISYGCNLDKKSIIIANKMNIDVK